MARWLVCDYGEVICLPVPAEGWVALEEATGWDSRSRGSFQDVYWASRRAYDRADLDAADFWGTVLGRPVCGGELSELIQVDVANWTHPNHESLSASIRARDRGVRLALFSNAPVEVADAVERTEWMAHFDPKFFSGRLRAAKPETQAYLAVLGALGTEPQELVFLDDRPVNVEAAAQLGMDARLFKSPAQIDEVLAA